MPMSKYLYIYIYMHINVHVNVYVYVCVCVRACLHASMMHVCIGTHTHLRHRSDGLVQLREVIMPCACCSAQTNLPIVPNRIGREALVSFGQKENNDVVLDRTSGKADKLHFFIVTS